MVSLFELEDKYIKDVITPLLPNAKFCYKVQNNINISELFKDSKFERVINEDSFFLHFTNLNSLLEIIRTKKIRMSDFNSFNDKFEVVFANSNIVGDNDHKEFEQLKSCLFALSLCEDTSKNIDNEYMWKNYAVKKYLHKGVCIRFKISKEISDYSPFHFGKIQYYPNIIIPELKELKERHIKFVNKYDYNIANLNSLLPIVCSMYKKSKPFKNENEVRLLLHVWKNRNSVHSISNLPIRHKYNLIEEEQIQYFFELELEKFNQIGGCPSPHVSIESIRYGKNLNQDKLGRIHQIIKDEFTNSFGRDLFLF